MKGLSTHIFPAHPSLCFLLPHDAKLAFGTLPHLANISRASRFAKEMIVFPHCAVLRCCTEDTNTNSTDLNDSVLNTLFKSTEDTNITSTDLNDSVLNALLKSTAVLVYSWCSNQL